MWFVYPPFDTSVSVVRQGHGWVEGAAEFRDDPIVAFLIKTEPTKYSNVTGFWNTARVTVRLKQLAGFLPISV